METHTTRAARAAHNQSAVTLPDQWLADAETALAAMTPEEREEAAIQLDILMRRLGVDEDAYIPQPPADSLRGQYIAAALEQAEYRTFTDGTIFGKIPACPGVLANEPTRAACAAELASVLDDWITVGLRHGHAIPILGGIDLNPHRLAS